MKPLTSNSELYEYLRGLSKILEERHAPELNEVVTHASQTAAGNVSTEFLGESRIALRRVMKEGHGILTAEERADLREVLAQIDGAFDRKRY
jgi:hypothetical protein